VKREPQQCDDLLCALENSPGLDQSSLPGFFDGGVSPGGGSKREPELCNDDLPCSSGNGPAQSQPSPRGFFKGVILSNGTVIKPDQCDCTLENSPAPNQPSPPDGGAPGGSSKEI
jgi:hypothetical protein